MVKYGFVTSTKVTKLVIRRGAIGLEVNNQLTVVTEVEVTNLLSL